MRYVQGPDDRVCHIVRPPEFSHVWTYCNRAYDPRLLKQNRYVKPVQGVRPMFSPGGRRTVAEGETAAVYATRRGAPTPLPPDIQRDLRLDELHDELSDLEALEHFQQLRREADERAW